MWFSKYINVAIAGGESLGGLFLAGGLELAELVWRRQRGCAENHNLHNSFPARGFAFHAWFRLGVMERAQLDTKAGFGLFLGCSRRGVDGYTCAHVCSLMMDRVIANFTRLEVRDVVKHGHRWGQNLVRSFTVTYQTTRPRKIRRRLEYIHYMYTLDRYS